MSIIMKKAQKTGYNLYSILYIIYNINDDNVYLIYIHVYIYTRYMVIIYNLFLILYIYICYMTYIIYLRYICICKI